MDFDTYERELWAGRAAAYERGFARLTAHAVGALLDAAGAGPGSRVLDVGTGPGVVAGAAAARGARVTAVDAEPSMAEAAARNVPGLDVRVAVLPDLPLPDGVPWPQDIPVAPFRPHSSPGAFAALLAGAGFTETAAQLLSWEHRVDPGEWWREVYRSRVGSSGVVIARQDDATVERIRHEFDRVAARYAAGDGMIALPATAVLASGTRP